MSLDAYFDSGTVLAIFGSSVYAPAHATDLDYTLLTPGGVYPAPLHAIESDIRKTLGPRYPQLFARYEDCPRMDFLSRRSTITHSPYDLLTLPENDIWLDTIFMTGDFYPGDALLAEHYQALFGQEYTAHVFLRIADSVQTFESSETRLYKRWKDPLLLFKAAEKVSHDAFPALRGVVSEYKHSYDEVLEKLRSGQIPLLEERRAFNDLISDFVNEAHEARLG